MAKPIKTPDCGAAYPQWVCCDNRAELNQISIQYNMKFGDIVINHTASEDNPIRIGVFLKRSGKNFNMTDCKGTFWQSTPSANMEVVGSVLKYPGDPLYAMDVSKHRSAPAQHTHVNNGVDDACKQCGKDLRDEIHNRITK